MFFLWKRRRTSLISWSCITDDFLLFANFWKYLQPLPLILHDIGGGVAQQLTRNGGIPLNTPGAGFCQFWTEVSVSIKIATEHSIGGIY